MTYLIIVAILLTAELLYFRIADKCNIIDKPNYNHKNELHRFSKRIAPFFIFSRLFFLSSI